MSRELDALVAEKVMGWVADEVKLGRLSVRIWRYPEGGSASSFADWNPTGDARNDYEVLKHVRETWTREQQDKFAEAWDDTMAERCTPNAQWWCLAYEPGDWSKAALRALGEAVG